MAGPDGSCPVGGRCQYACPGADCYRERTRFADTPFASVILEAPDGERGTLIGPADKVAALVRPEAVVDGEAGCTCGWRGASDDVEDHPCPLPDPQDLLDCCGHPLERHYGEYGDGVPRCEFCDCSVKSW